MKLDEALVQLEKRITEKVNSRYSGLVNDINECFSNVVQLAVSNASVTESSISALMKEFGEDFNSLKSEINAFDTIDDMKNAFVANNDLLQYNKLSAHSIESYNRLLSKHVTLEEVKYFDDNNDVNSTTYQDMASTKHGVKENKANRLKKTNNADNDTTTDILDNINNEQSVSKEESASETTRPFICTECGFAFIRNQHLKKHLKSKHSKIKEYSCDDCDYTASWKDYLKSHMRFRHKKTFT